jgi:hypothetical protein
MTHALEPEKICAREVSICRRRTSDVDPMGAFVRGRAKSRPRIVQQLDPTEDTDHQKTASPGKACFACDLSDTLIQMEKELGVPKPGDLLIGVIDFFAVLVPGVIAAGLIVDAMGRNLEEANTLFVAGLVTTGWVLGHVLDGIGS